MGVEIEKKYHLSFAERERVKKRLVEVNAQFCHEEFEENTLYAGGVIDCSRTILRVRRAANKTVFTYKERDARSSAIKRQREEETNVDDGEALHRILCALGFRPSLVYEKRRATWRIGNVEVVLDELPFGLFMEIEGGEREIFEVEELLDLTHAQVETATYPELTAQHGAREGEMIEARFRAPKD